MEVRNRTRGKVVCSRLETARTMGARMRGLLGRDRMEDEAGMLFSATRLVPLMWMHTFGMRFAIDIVFLDRHDRVLKIDHELAPRRLSSVVFGARKALELGAGCARHAGCARGDQIVFVRP